MGGRRFPILRACHWAPAGEHSGCFRTVTGTSSAVVDAPASLWGHVCMCLHQACSQERKCSVPAFCVGSAQEIKPVFPGNCINLFIGFYLLLHTCAPGQLSPQESVRTNGPTRLDVPGKVVAEIPGNNRYRFILFSFPKLALCPESDDFSHYTACPWCSCHPFAGQW